MCVKTLYNIHFETEHYIFFGTKSLECFGWENVLKEFKYFEVNFVVWMII